MRGLSRLGAAVILLAAWGQSSSARSTPPPLSAEASQALDDSISVLVDAYKAGRLTRGVAVQHLAGLIEPLPGFAIQTTDSMALDLFEATREVLRQRLGARYNLPASLR